MNLWNMTDIKYLLKKYNFHFSKSLGQNFLIDRYVCPRMVEMSDISENTGVIEVGPGIGVLTVEVAKRAKKVIAVEIDKRLLPILDETLSNYDNVKVINQDILKMNLNELIKKEFEGLDVVICANLPYYVASSIVMYLLEESLSIKSITVMVQKELAERIVALPGSREVGVLSLAVRYYSEPDILFDVYRESFKPQPKVDSSVIRLNIRQRPIVEVKSQKLFFKVIRAAFSQRRKTIINSLCGGVNLEKDLLRDLLDKLHIDVNKRAENLLLEDFRDISDEIFNLTGMN